MDISEIRVKLVDDSTDRLKAYCSITVDGCFVIRDLKVIEGTSGLFVAMPSRKLAARCPGCGSKNHLRAHFCNECGKKLTDTRVYQAADRNKLHADVAHPINTECRKFIQTRVIEEYQAECERAKQPDYVAKSLDNEDFEDGASPYDALVQELKVDQNKARVPEQKSEAPAPIPASFEQDEEEQDEEEEGPEAAEAEPVPAEAPPGKRTEGEAFGAGLL